jgi:hypothetical protein
MPRYGLSRRPPYPFDVKVNGVGMMLVAAPDGEMVSTKSKPLDALPTSFDYGSQSPFLERVSPQRQLYFGFGQRAELPGAARRYWYGIGADASIDGQMMKGAAFTSETVRAGQRIRQFIVALHGGLPTVFAIANDAAMRRVADGNWAASLAPSASALRQATRFKDAGVSAIDALYVGTFDNNLYQYDGAAWHLANITDGAPEGKAYALERVGDEFWVGWGNKAAKAQADPMQRGSYAAPITIGDASSQVTWLRQNKDQLYIFKEDSVYGVKSDGTDADLFPSLRGFRDVENGVNAAVWLDALWAPFGDAYYQIRADAVLSPEGTELLLENGSEVRGRIAAAAGHATWANYELLYNSATGDTYLLKYGSWVSSGDPNNPDAATFVPVHHGALKKWAGKRGSCLAVIPGSVLGTTNDRLYAGFYDGTAEYCVLPRDGPNPSQDPGCSFDTADSYIYLPSHTANFHADDKVWRGFSVYGPQILPSASVRIDYRTDPNASWTAFADADGNPITFTASGQRFDFPTGVQVVARQIEVRVVLRKDPAAAASLTPVVDTIGIVEQVRPAVALEHRFTIAAGNRVALRDGRADRRRAEQVREELRTALISPAPVPVVLPDGTTLDMNYIDYSEALLPSKNRSGLEWTVLVRGIQLKTLTPTSAIGGLAHGSLENYTHGELETLLA